MEYKFLGKTSVQVSRLCFGTMSFGGDADEETSAAMFQRCEAGINFFDCANVYQLLPLTQSEKLGVIPYSPLGGGLLTGKYGPDQRPDSGRLMENKMYQTRCGEGWIYEVAGEFATFARERGFEPVSLAVAWVASHPGVTAPIIGARNVAQLEGPLKAAGITMTPELRAEISALSPEPAVATDRTEERAA